MKEITAELLTKRLALRLFETMDMGKEASVPVSADLRVQGDDLFISATFYREPKDGGDVGVDVRADACDLELPMREFEARIVRPVAALIVANLKKPH